MSKYYTVEKRQTSWGDFKRMCAEGMSDEMLFDFEVREYSGQVFEIFYFWRRITSDGKKIRVPIRSEVIEEQ